MIISASRRTDIPAFYSKWFAERIKAGYYIKVNPFNTHQRKVISLRPENVDAIVFWTKNPKPLMKYLPLLDEMGFRYYFQFTINDFPKQFEPTLPTLTSRIRTFQELSDTIGSHRVIWRYDPIIYSSLTPLSFIEERFAYIAKELAGYTTRVVISFLDMYGKTKNKFTKLEKEYGVTFYDLLDERYSDAVSDLASTLSHIAKPKGLAMYSCAERIDLEHFGIQHGACIDKALLNEIFHLALDCKKDPNQRNECLCAVSEEMGTYNTCKFNCTYCYAVQSEVAVEHTIKAHNWRSPLLIGSLEEGEEFSEQLKLF